MLQYINSIAEPNYAVAQGDRWKTVTYTIAEPCVDLLDRACVEECPVDCIYVGDRMAYIHPGECVDCGACEPVCPVEAIFFESDVPEQWQAYTAANAEFCTELGASGGAGGLRFQHDAALVVVLPRLSAQAAGDGRA